MKKDKSKNLFRKAVVVGLIALGMLAGTIVYVNAGKELARIDSLSGILSPGVFAVLGIFPLTVKKLLVLYKRKFRPDVASNIGKQQNSQKSDIYKEITHEYN
jgi:hypothetical protein